MIIPPRIKHFLPPHDKEPVYMVTDSMEFIWPAVYSEKKWYLVDVNEDGVFGKEIYRFFYWISENDAEKIRKEILNKIANSRYDNMSEEKRKSLLLITIKNSLDSYGIKKLLEMEEEL